MDVDLGILVFFVLAAVWVFLPFAPALCEIWTLRDDLPVEVVRHSEVDIRHFASGYRKFIEANLAEELARCREEGRSREGRLADGTGFLVIPGTNGEALSIAERDAPCETIVLSCDRLELPPNGVYFGELYAAGPIHAGDRCVFRALLSDESIELGQASQSLRWLHAGGMVAAGEGSLLHGRVSAGVSIELAAHCRFERLQAPAIIFGRQTSTRSWQGQHRRLDPSDLPGELRLEAAAGRWLIRNHLKLPAGSAVENNLVITGKAHLGAGSRIAGSVKSRKDMYLGHGVEIEGSVISGRDLYLGEGCHVRGPVLAERVVRVAAGCRIGSPEQLTTVHAAEVRIAPGTVTHGTVWAHGKGLMESIEKGA